MAPKKPSESVNEQRNSSLHFAYLSLINIIVLSFKLLVDCWDVFVYGRG